MPPPLPSNRAPQRRGDGGVVGSLPDDLLHSILRSLPLKQAARTSALSRRWAPKWLHALAAYPVLDLTDQNFARGQSPARAVATHGAPLDAIRVALVAPSASGLVGDGGAFGQDVVGWVAAAVAVDLMAPPSQDEDASPRDDRGRDQQELHYVEELGLQRRHGRSPRSLLLILLAETFQRLIEIIRLRQNGPYLHLPQREPRAMIQQRDLTDCACDHKSISTLTRTRGSDRRIRDDDAAAIHRERSTRSGDAFEGRNSLEYLALGRISLRAVPLPAAGLAGLRSLSLSHALFLTDDAVEGVLANRAALESLTLTGCHLLTSVSVASERLPVSGARGLPRRARAPVVPIDLGEVEGDIAMPALRDARLTRTPTSQDYEYPFLSRVAHARVLTLCSKASREAPHLRVPAQRRQQASTQEILPRTIRPYRIGRGRTVRPQGADLTQNVRRSDKSEHLPADRLCTRSEPFAIMIQNHQRLCPKISSTPDGPPLPTGPSAVDEENHKRAPRLRSKFSMEADCPPGRARPSTPSYNTRPQLCHAIHTPSSPLAPNSSKRRDSLSLSLSLSVHFLLPQNRPRNRAATRPNSLNLGHLPPSPNPLMLDLLHLPSNNPTFPFNLHDVVCGGLNPRAELLTSTWKGSSMPPPPPQLNQGTPSLKIFAKKMAKVVALLSLVTWNSSWGSRNLHTHTLPQDLRQEDGEPGDTSTEDLGPRIKMDGWRPPRVPARPEHNRQPRWSLAASDAIMLHKHSSGGLASDEGRPGLAGLDLEGKWATKAESDGRRRRRPSVIV
ncbi:hypothetical protein HU200_056931 [Digitaria exilis]|uniref:F-box domain-containing protein n=1 Tax=Digitaria exilis TaxID=1010633 RepID=A0A835AGC5_9POAL|nr:hypothetical protein HU200_056931 [Digitaria exilis]